MVATKPLAPESRIVVTDKAGNVQPGPHRDVPATVSAPLIYWCLGMDILPSGAFREVWPVMRRAERMGDDVRYTTDDGTMAELVLMALRTGEQRAGDA